MADRHEPYLDPNAPLPAGAGAAADAARVEPQGIDTPPDDPLLQSLVWLTRHHGRERSAASLLVGMPVEGALGPDQAVRVMRDAGYNAGLVQRKIADIHSLLLPAVLLLKSGDACILVKRDPNGAGVTTDYEVVMPGAEFHACRATEAELQGEYTGVAFVATPKPAEHLNAAELMLLDPGKHWLWGTLRRFTPYYRSALLAAMLTNILMMVTGIVTSVIYDKVIPHQAFVTLWALASGAATALVFDLVARQLRSHLIDTAGKKADLIVGSILFRQALGVRLEHRPESAGAYAHQLGQIEIVRDFFASASLSVVSDLPFIVLFLAMTFVIGGPLGWVLALAIPLIIGLSLFVQGALRRSMRANMAQQADLHGLLVEAVEGLEDVKANGATGRFVHRYEAASAAAAESALRARAVSAWSNNLSAAMQQVITVVMLVWGVYLIHDGVISGGALIGAVMFAGRAVAPLSSVVSLATRYQGARAAMISLNQLMALPTEHERGKTYVPPPKLSGRIALHEVGFTYPAVAGQEHPPKVLKGVNLRFAPGERVAILGRIGSGKSTILRLLAGLYLPTEGQVEVDGIDLRQVDPADYRTQIGFVAQEPRLFKGTLRDNVLLGRGGISAARLTEVARLTGLERLIAAHPLGWELPVGEMGSLLSGGQRQLVALARCLVSQPQILLMDEPTSSMDAQSEILFLRQLKEAVGQRTLVMVTHRPAVLELAERIVVVDAGRLVMDGPKAQVLAALSGAKPEATAAADNAPTNVHRHPSTQPVQREAAV